MEARSAFAVAGRLRSRVAKDRRRAAAVVAIEISPELAERPTNLLRWLAVAAAMGACGW